MFKNAVIIAVVVLCSTASYAEEMAVSAHISIEGGGLEVTKKISDKFNARIAFHQYTYQGTDPLATLKQMGNLLTDALGISKSDNAYDHNGKQQLLSVMADWYPGEESQSRFSVGLGYNNSNDDIVGRELPLGGYNLGANHYSAAQVGKLQGTLKYNSLAPYIGFGWGNPVAENKKWGFVADVGMLYQGAPKVTLSATGTAAGLQTDVAAERARLEKDTWTWTPMVSIGLSYQW